MEAKDVSFIMPSYNTLAFTILAYDSLRKYYPANEIIILDDGSSDGSGKWLDEQLKADGNLRGWHNETGAILGHTVTYDLGIKMSRSPLVSIFHSDMVCCRHYLENMLKHWAPKTVVGATRIEPEGIYPPGREKILKPFGLEPAEFKREALDKFAEEEMVASKDQTTRGIFAPWLISKEDFLTIGGHDAQSFAPFPEEDADLFLRMHLAGYTLIQSRDALCWHWISRSHRGWAKNGVGHDDSMFIFYQNRSRRNYVRKWHRWMQFDEWHHPVAHKVFNIGFVLRDVSGEDFLYAVEPWATHVYVDNWPAAEEYLAKEQLRTKIDLRTRIFDYGYIKQHNNDVVLEFSQKDFMTHLNDNMHVVVNLTDMLSDGVEDNSEFEYGIFKLKTKVMKDLSATKVKI